MKKLTIKLISRCCNNGFAEVKMLIQALRSSGVEEDYGIWKENTCPECKEVLTQHSLNGTKESWIYIPDMRMLIPANAVKDSKLVAMIIRFALRGSLKDVQRDNKVNEGQYKVNISVIDGKVEKEIVK